MKSTIYALSTLFGKSAIAIVRVSGPFANESLYKLTKIKTPENYKMKLASLYNLEGELIDKPLIVFFSKENSYTGEDLVEYHLHGSISVIKELLSNLSKIEDHRLAERGEFTKRALQNNKIDVINAEGILDLINAETDEQRRLALKELSNEVSKKYLHIKNSLMESLALLESTIDFSDEDIPDDLFDEINDDILKLKDYLKAEEQNYTKNKKIKEGINISIIGIPNSGKSTLINFLSKEEIAIVSEEEGTTRDIVSNYLNFNGYLIKINDTAGLRLTDNKIEAKGVEKALNLLKNSDINIFILDYFNLEKSYQEVKNYISKNDIILVNKSFEDDKTNVDSIVKERYIPVSLLKEKNLDIFMNNLTDKVINVAGNSENSIVIQERHKNIVEEVVNNLEEFLNAEDIVIKAHHLRLALNSVNSILGYTNVEDLLDIIFNKFCIGK